MATAKANRTRALFDWLNRVLTDAELSPNAFKVAFQIGQYFNSRRGGAAWPSLQTIATATGTDKATVIRTVRRLRERGHLIVEPGKPGRGHSNRYRMAKPRKGAPAHLSEPGKGAAAHLKVSRVKGASASLKGAPAHLNHLEPSMEEATASSIGERERSHALAVIPGAPAPRGGALEGMRTDFAAWHTAFDALLAIWKRPHGDEDAEAAWPRFLKACCSCQEYPDDIAAAILASAYRWVAAYQHKPEMLKPLWKWLSSGAWKNLPPPPSSKQPRKSGKPSLSNKMINLE